jgi:threonine synthase
MAKILYFECSRCGKQLSPDGPQTVCPADGGSLYARYDMETLKQKARAGRLIEDRPDMWRYRELLPDATPVTMGEGFTPLIRSSRYPGVWIKDESKNPTGSFKARGLGMAVTMAKHYGLKKLAIPSAGNAAGALAAYCALAGIEAHIFVPGDAPRANLVECMVHGAKLTLVDGLISDCGRIVAERKAVEGWFDVATLKEPFRLEGKKTMGYEIAEQLNWILPDAIIFPTGGGISLIAMWKAFAELEQLGFLRRGPYRPRMIAVQARGCSPISKAFVDGKAACEPCTDALTRAAGMRVPKSYGDYLILEILRKSNGTVVTVSDEEMVESVRECARTEGIFPSLEGAAAMAGVGRLITSGYLKPSETVVVFNTGTGLKYLDIVAAEMDRLPQPARAGMASSSAVSAA